MLGSGDHPSHPRLLVPMGRACLEGAHGPWPTPVALACELIPRNVQSPALNKIDAIVAADGTYLIPKLVILKLILAALSVDDADEILAAAEDAHGNFIARVTRPSHSSQRSRRATPSGRCATSGSP